MTAPDRRVTVAKNDDPGSAARIATISALIVVASFVASKAARDAILLANFNVKRLPIFIAISVGISLPLILIAGRLMARYGPARLMPALNAISALLAIGEWAMLQRYPRPIAVLVFLHLGTSGAVLASGFWSIVNERFDVQSAKRHIGRIGMGATFGGILGGVAAERTAVYLSPDKILLVLAGLQLACGVTLYLFGRVAHRGQVVTQSDGTWSAFRVVTKSRLLRNVGAIVVLGAIAAGMMDYVFKADIVAASPRDGVLRALAIFYTVTNVITAILQMALCGPLITRLGVPRSVASLPITVTVFGVFALATPVSLASAITRGAEAVTRNSLYRSAYELLYAPLPEVHKRPTKVVLDVGADRIGDLLGAQLVGLFVYLTAEPRLGLLVATVVAGVIAVMVAMRLPRSYTTALEDSLLARAGDPALAELDPSAQPDPWITLDRLPTLGQAGDFAPLSLRVRHRSSEARSGRRARTSPVTTVPAPATAPPWPPALGVPAAADRHPEPARPPIRDRILEAVADLRSPDPERIKRVLEGKLPLELAAHTIELVGRDDVSREALRALTALAPRITGLLVDVLLDHGRDVTVRRRLPAVLLVGEPALAVWGLWRALVDPSFEVRYRSGAVLARLAAAGHLGHITIDDVLEAVRRELSADASQLRSHRILDDLVTAAEDRGETDELLLQRAGTGLEHVFTVLGLALPAEPLRIALHAVQTDDPELRGTALEYLESILPPDVRAQLWPLLEGEAAAPATIEPPASLDPAVASVPGVAAIALPAVPTTRRPRSRDELLAALSQSYPAVVEKLRQRRRSA
jgi:AAA family ATP:ADP antiporter